MDRCRENKKGVMAESLDELIERGKNKNQLKKGPSGWPKYHNLN